jgi:DnaJ-class molecular chaperone
MESDVLFENYRKSLEGLKNTSSCSQYPLNYYDLLEITPSANQTTIKKAFQKKVMKVHPDKGGNQEMFLKVMKAYKVLSDLTTKEVYDNYGERGLNEYFGFIY